MSRACGRVNKCAWTGHRIVAVDTTLDGARHDEERLVPVVEVWARTLARGTNLMEDLVVTSLLG